MGHMPAGDFMRYLFPILFLTQIFCCIPHGGLANGYDCLNYDNFIQQLNSIPFPDHFYSAYTSHPVFEGEYFFLTEKSSGLVVGLLTAENEMEILSITPTWDRPCDVKILNGKAFVADGLAGLQVFDISDPLQPQWLAHIDTPGTAMQVDVTADRVFILDTYLGFTVIDVEEVRSPRIIANVPIPVTLPCNMVRHGDIMVLVNGSNLLYLFDIANPDEPFILSEIEYLTDLIDLDIEGDTLGLLTSENRMEFHDFQIPLLPQIISSVDLPYNSRYIRFAGQLALASCSQFGIVGIDITDLTQPQVGFRYPTTGSGYSGFARKDERLLIVGNTVELLGFTRPGFSAPWGPPLFSTVQLPGMHSDFTTHGDYAYVLNYSDGQMSVVDLSDPTAPQITSTIELPHDQCTDLVAQGEHLYVSYYGGRVYVYSLADPSLPVYLTQIETWAWIHELLVRDELLVCLHNFKFSLFSLADPENPAALFASTNNYPESGAFKDDLLFLATDSPDGLEIWDISDPAQPTLAATNNEVHNPRGVSIDGPFLYVTNYDHNNGLHVFDISDPLSPVLLPELPRTASTGPCLVQDGTAYLLGDGMVHVLDVTDPAAPARVGILPSDILCQDINIWNGFILSLDRFDKLDIYPLRCGALSTVPLPESEQGRDKPSLTVWPNPFNPSTALSWTARESERTKVSVYDLKGHRIAVIADRVFPEGECTVQWNGRNSLGANLPSAVYLLIVESESTRLTGRISLIR